MQTSKAIRIPTTDNQQCNESMRMRHETMDNGQKQERFFLACLSNAMLLYILGFLNAFRLAIEAVMFWLEAAGI